MLALFTGCHCEAHGWSGERLGFPRISVAEFDCRFQVHYGEVVAGAVRDAQHVAAISSAGGGAILQAHELHCGVFGLKEFAVGLGFHFVGLSVCSQGVVPCVGAKLVPHLKARKHFFKVFSAVRKVLSCGAATPRDETPLARFQCARLPNGGAAESPA
jgi:hypothetical protein